MWIICQLYPFLNNINAALVLMIQLILTRVDYTKVILGLNSVNQGVIFYN